MHLKSTGCLRKISYASRDPVLIVEASLWARNNLYFTARTSIIHNRISNFLPSVRLRIVLETLIEYARVGIKFTQ
ncbi:c434723b-286f-4992-bd12-cdcfc9afbe2c [Sclerotinia trifoliorum]|uniref:C434723b-286f-4992-bd12-cdcfc9afbe2c n=1 Tax=Sclerotinia trifoliorum TaxID=28548 RepID=A0A8H2ZQ09_9HELO|nr:c434723b-286f-4992-bd12-cdcfc9afbe2c [Sclerotinia trifoliorum]